MGLTKGQKSRVAILLCGAFLVVLNQTLLSPALPRIMVDMNVEATTVQWLTSGFSLVEAVIIPLSAFFMGRFRTRQLFIGGMILFACGSILAAFSPIFPLLLAGRMIQAVAAGLVMPMSMSLILLTYPREERGAAMGLVSLVIAIAPAIGPSISGLLVDFVGWRLIFVIVTVIALIAALIAWKILEDYKEFDPVSFDLLSVILSTVGLTLVLYGFSSFTTSDNPLMIGLMVLAGIVIIGFFVRRQLALDEPLLKVDVLRARNFRIAVCTVVLMQAALIGSGVIVPLYIQNILGQSATVTGLVMLPGALIGAFMALLAGRLFDRYGVRGLALTGAVGIAIGAVGISFFGMDTSVLFVCGTYTIMAVGLQTMATPINTWGVNSLDNRVIQHGNALNSTMFQVGASFGTALITSMTGLAGVVAPDATGLELQFAGYHLAYQVTAVMLILVVLIIIVFVRARKHSAGYAKAVEELDAKGGEKVYRVRDVMNREAMYIFDTDTIADALRIFTETDTSGVPIVNKSMRVVGFISDGDVMKYLARENVQVGDTTMNMWGVYDNESIQEKVVDLLKLNVMRIATKRAITVDSATSLDEACAILAKKSFKKLPVVDNGRLVGALSRRNVIHAIIEHTA